MVVQPDRAQALAVVLHELATNAAKYGSLSVSGGHVVVDWSRGPAGRLALRAFSRHPGTVHTVLRGLPGMWELFVRLVSGETSLAEQLTHRRVRALTALLTV